MKIITDVLGVEQAMNFDTMEQSCFVVLDVLGVVTRVAISEQQMEQLTVAAAQQKAMEGGEVLTETIARSEQPPDPEQKTAAELTTERSFSVMAELGEQDFPSTGEIETPGMEDVYGGGEEEEAKVARLRQRAPLMGVAAIAAPEVEMPSLPRMPGTTDDDGFPQG